MSAQANTTSIESQIAKRKSSKSVVAGIGLIIIGAGLYFISTILSDTTSSLYMVCTVGGFAAMIVGVLKLCFGGKETIYLPTKSPVKSYSIYFEALSGDELVKLIEQGKFDEIRDARRKESGPVRLDVQRSKDDRFVSLQVMQFVPYTYEKVSGTYYFQEGQAPEVAASVGNPAK
ncbi:hypothetical protein [Rikenella microfusus]|uniref:hypothetical protein n=1 Tax=Rikenella microfusus TaxID=28139 RepID=UPI00248E461E|nr:hypothetical protein [Rikenella microfusus]